MPCKINGQEWESPFKEVSLETASLDHGMAADGTLLPVVSSLKFGSLKIGSLKAVKLQTGSLKASDPLPSGMAPDGKLLRGIDPFVGGGSLTYGMAPDGTLLRGINPLGGTMGVKDGKMVIGVSPFSADFVGGGGKDVELKSGELAIGSLKAVSLKPGSKNAAPVSLGFHGSALEIGTLKIGSLKDKAEKVGRGRAGSTLKSTTVLPGGVR